MSLEKQYFKGHFLLFYYLKLLIFIREHTINIDSLYRGGIITQPKASLPLP